MPDEHPRTTYRSLAAGPDWAVWEVNCALGPRDRPFEERHAMTSIAAVLRGTFEYRSARGAETLYPGSFLLGNAGGCYECGHEHGTGDRCVAFGFAPSLFEEIAASAAGTGGYRFERVMLPAVEGTARALVEIQSRASTGQRAGFEEFAIALAETVIRSLAATSPRDVPLSTRDRRRIGDALRFIDEHHGEKLDLTRLSGISCMSRFHFLRTFRKIVGATPHQYLLGLRLRRSAARIRTTRDPIAAIATDAGFEDLSNFYQHFRRTFGVAPAALRPARSGSGVTIGRPG